MLFNILLFVVFELQKQHQQQHIAAILMRFIHIESKVIHTVVINNNSTYNLCE